MRGVCVVVCAPVLLQHGVSAGGGVPTVENVKSRLDPANAALFDSLPLAIKLQLLLDRDPHGNVQVSKIETEKLLCGMMEARIAARTAAGTFVGAFASQFHFFGCRNSACVALCVCPCSLVAALLLPQTSS